MSQTSARVDCRLPSRTMSIVYARAPRTEISYFEFFLLIEVSLRCWMCVNCWIWWSRIIERVTRLTGAIERGGSRRWFWGTMNMWCRKLFGRRGLNLPELHLLSGVISVIPGPNRFTFLIGNLTFPWDRPRYNNGFRRHSRGSLTNTGTTGMGHSQ